MSVTIKKATLWRTEVPHERGALASALQPLAVAGAHLHVVMGYAFPGDPSRAAIEVFPVTGKRQQDAARAAGLAPSGIACLLVQGRDRAGLGAELSEAIAAAGINVSFIMAHAIGRGFSAVFGFASEADAANAARAMRRVPDTRRRPRTPLAVVGTRRVRAPVSLR
jgi:hypothetical protein